MADKKIEIKIAATGGDQAAREINKVADAAASANETKVSGADDVLRRIEEETKAQEALAAAEREAAEQSHRHQEQAGEDYVANGRRMREVAFAAGAIGVAASAAATTLQSVRDAVNTVDTTELRRIDPAMADAIESAKSLAGWLEDPIGQLAALANGGTTVKEAFASMNEQLALNAKSRADQIDRIIKRGDEQVEAIKKLSEDLKRANALLDATDKADSAERDRTDAAAIRNGAAPEDVRAQRAKDDAEKEIARINRDADAKKAGVQEAFELAKQKRRNVEDVRNAEGARPEDVAKAQEAANKAQADFEKRQADAQQAPAIAAQQRRAVRATAAGTIEDAAGDKSKRLADESDKERQKREREAQKQAAAVAREQQQKAREAERAEREQSANDKQAGAIGQRVEKLLPKGVTNEFRDAVQKASARLQDGAQGNELKDLAGLVNQLAQSRNGDVRGIQSELESIRRSMRTLDERQKIMARRDHFR